MQGSSLPAAANAGQPGEDAEGKGSAEVEALPGSKITWSLPCFPPQPPVPSPSPSLAPRTGLNSVHFLQELESLRERAAKGPGLAMATASGAETEGTSEEEEEEAWATATPAAASEATREERKEDAEGAGAAGV